MSEADDIVYEEDADDEAQTPRERLMMPPAERERLAPKVGLASMVYFVMDLRFRGQLRSGADAAETWVRLTPVELEKLEDIAETLEYFRLQRLMAKLGVKPGRTAKR